jgi:hypothetical protein
MKNLLAISGVALGIFILGPGQSTAQAPYLPPRPTSPYARPQLSPYLNLLRGGSPSANYYLGVVPERDRRQFERTFGTAVQDLERRVEAPPAVADEELVPRLPSTGHPAYFMTYSTYFNLGSSPLSTANPTQPVGSPRGARR